MAHGSNKIFIEIKNHITRICTPFKKYNDHARHYSVAVIHYVDDLLAIIK